jgi:hypothetical protein
MKSPWRRKKTMGRQCPTSVRYVLAWTALATVCVRANRLEPIDFKRVCIKGSKIMHIFEHGLTRRTLFMALSFGQLRGHLLV